MDHRNEDKFWGPKNPQNIHYNGLNNAQIPMRGHSPLGNGNGNGYMQQNQWHHQGQMSPQSMPFYPNHEAYQQQPSVPYYHQYQQYQQQQSLPYYLPTATAATNNNNRFGNADGIHQDLFQQHQQNPYFNGPNNSNYLVTRNRPMGSASQTNAAASYFAKKNLKTTIAPTGPPKQNNDIYATRSSSEDSSERLSINFRSIIVKAPPQLPSGLLGRIEAGDVDGGQQGGGKVRVVVRVATKDPLGLQEENQDKPKFFQVDNYLSRCKVILEILIS